MTLEIGMTVQHKLTRRVGRVIGVQHANFTGEADATSLIYVVKCDDEKIIRSLSGDFQLFTRMPSR